jgi:hypothetical protein
LGNLIRKSRPKRKSGIGTTQFRAGQSFELTTIQNRSSGRLQAILAIGAEASSPTSGKLFSTSAYAICATLNRFVTRNRSNVIYHAQADEQRKWSTSFRRRHGFKHAAGCLPGAVSFLHPLTPYPATIQTLLDATKAAGNRDAKLAKVRIFRLKTAKFARHEPQPAKIIAR